MKINRKHTKKVGFEDLPIGECFVYDGNLFIKISEYKDKPNAFNFDANHAARIYKDSLIEPITMELNEV